MPESGTHEGANPSPCTPCRSHPALGTPAGSLPLHPPHCLHPDIPILTHALGTHPGVCSSAVSPTSVPSPPPQGPSCLTLPALPVPTARLSLPTPPCLDNAVTEFPASFWSLSPSVPPVVPVTASFMQQSRAVLLL